MSGLLMFGRIKSSANAIVKSYSTRCPGLRGDDPYITLQAPKCRPYLLFKCFQGCCTPNTVCRKKGPTFSGAFHQHYAGMHITNNLKHHTQTACKKIFQIYYYNSEVFPHICRVAQAFILASSRSQLIIPGAFALIFGGLSFSEAACSELANISLGNIVSAHREKWQSYVARLFSIILEALILLLRALYLAVLFSPSVAMAPFADNFGVHFRKLWLQVLHRTLEKGGPVFIKWGQWAATRPDLFPGDLCAELAKLHTNAPEHSFDYTKRTIEGAFGRKISDIFESIEAIPVASGSIAQVHRASLRFRYPGQKVKPIEVAVKVRHPGVSESIRRDFLIINAIAKVTKFIPTLKWLRLDESVQQFAVFMMPQVDLAWEAAHLNRFIYNFRQWKDVSFPKPVYPLVHPAVLVETYEHGESVAHFVDELEGQNRIKAALAHIGTNALLKMLLVDNFIHADMHPGNILVRVTDSKYPQKRLAKSKPHVIFLDVGMTAELSKMDQVNLLELFKAVARRDGRTAAECTLRFSKQQNCPNPEAFIKVVEEYFIFWATPEGDLVHPADAMQQLLEQVRHHKVNIDGNVCNVIVTTLVLEGWQRKLDPKYDMMHALQTMLFKAEWAKSLSYTIEGVMAP
ncbi:hypothetical protein Nepgr_026760 [Nepenthes gracilis]|uniref:ABC1 atypical kinase-like domain-containing protein n=1 Tax=Nepenthes gracilis TaxID=150966 RepID=A0AAD3TAH0_NEPGR|nr:hypothetical protein Nepgr_026760 [Nepenthes gracilis]